MIRIKTRTFAAVISAVVGLAFPCAAEYTAEVGIDEQIGDLLPLDSFEFTDEDGEPIVLAELFDRPVVLTLVYFRCPGICTPLLQEVARVADLCDLEPGEDYRLVTVSFDPGESHELAKPKRANMIASLENKDVPLEGWRFLTGDADNIDRLTDAVGFRYVPDRNEVDYVHAATVIFVSSDGLIARYLNGTQFNPADLKLAVIDASEGRARSFMQRMQRLCYSFDPDGRAYVLQINRVILLVTVVFVGVFAALFLFRGTTGRLARLHGNGQST